MNPVFGLRGLLRWRQPAYLAAYADFAAADPAVGFLDLAPAWRAYLAGRARRQVLPDGLHPDPEAARKVIVPQVAALLAPVWGGRCATGD